MKKAAIVWITLFCCADILCCAAANTKIQSQITQIVERQLVDGNIPGAVVFVGQNQKKIFFRAFGDEVSVPFVEPMRKDTIFDIASLSKPVATAPSILILIDSGKISLDDYVSKYIPDFANGGKENVQIKHLLSHTSGLPSYMNAEPLRKKFGNQCADKVIEEICRLEALNEPGEKSRYSCLGYITLGRIVEIVSGKSLDVFATENIFSPLGMKNTFYNPPAAKAKRIAAAEIRNGQLNRGAVHDPLAELMGGVSGNAGVFTTADDLAKFCRMVLNDGRANGKQILSVESVKLLTSEQYFGRAYGFDVNSDNHSWIKGDFGAKTFCHSGYTGTSIVCDPVSKKFIIILTNRVYPNDKGSVRQMRIQVANAVYKTLQ